MRNKKVMAQLEGALDVINDQIAMLEAQVRHYRKHKFKDGDREFDPSISVQKELDDLYARRDEIMETLDI